MNKEKMLEKVKEPYEKLLLSKALDRAVFCIRNYEKTFTDFLNPVKAYEIVDFVKSESDLKIAVFGGCDGCERIMIGFAPEYEEITNDVFPIVPVKINYEAKFSKNLTHRDFLGSVLGTGIMREKVGDIVLKEGYAVVFLAEDIADYVCINLDKVSHTKVKCEKFNITEEFSAFSDVKELTIIVSSLRIDTVVANAFKISRVDAAALIKGGRVFVNWKCEENVSKNIVENSVITVRGYGRVKIKGVEGKTRKDRFVLSALKYI